MYQNSQNGGGVSPSRPVRPSLFQTLNEVKKQVNFESFDADPLINELCLIIAEVLVRPPESVMRIRGSEIEAAVVQEVYRMLTYEHLDLVRDNFKEQKRIIHKKTAYLQTALYNAVFEYEHHYTNLVKHDLGI